VQACQGDERIIAAFLFGSYTNGRPDQHSDLDLCLITTDEAYDDFVAQRDSFARSLGEPLFMEDFNIPNILFLIFPDGSEVEIHHARESQLDRLFNERYAVLVDKKNVTANISISNPEVDPAEQTEKLRRLIQWFWHDFSHFVTAMGRDQLWWAHGQLDVLRSMCAGLARLKNDFSDTEVDEEVYFKIEKAMPVEILSPIRDTFCPMEKESMLKAGHKLLQFYKEIAVPLANEHGIHYPKELETLMTERLMSLQ